MSFYCALILYIQDNKGGSIIPTVVLPTTDIIEPLLVHISVKDSFLFWFIFLVLKDDFPLRIAFPRQQKYKISLFR